MTFTRPDDIAKLSKEDIAAKRAEAVEARTAIANLPDEELTVERLDEFDAIVEFIEEADAHVAELDATETALEERRAAVRAATEEEPEGDEPDEGDDADGEDTDDTEDTSSEVPDDASEITEREAVTASARRGAAGKAARRAPKPEVDPAPLDEAPKVAITAAANVPEFNSGQALESFRELATAFQSRSAAWARTISKEEAAAKPRPVTKLSRSADQRGVGRIDKAPKGGEFQVNSKMSTQDQFDLVMKAANERQRFGSGGLIAAGGWCAPSETIYGNFLSLETVSGILDIAEVTADRGGINFTKGPDYSSIATNFGFMQTEAQAEAGTEKLCYDVTCPPFEEVRLDAVGFCITAGILTEAAYPELIDRTLQIGATAHAHKVNASVISRILTHLGAAVDHVELGSATADLLDAAALQAQRLRYTYAMAPDATVEAVFPVWAVELFRSDLARRSGLELFAVSTGDVERWFAARGVRVQWVYDWQSLTAASTTPAAGAAWTSLPDTVEFMMYPAGSYVKLTTNVIQLDAIYDSVNTKTNTFTAAFFEEGIAVANTGADGVLVSVSVADLYGRTGAHDLAAPVAP